MKDRRLDCAPDELALKSLFLGPQSENSSWFVESVVHSLSRYFVWRKTRFPSDGRAISPADQSNDEFKHLQSKMRTAVESLLKELEAEKPKFTPRYIGHMVSETSLPALLGEFVMLLHNPNNASREASHVGLRIEREAIEALASMVGFEPSVARGHFTSGGTLANFEALWRMIHRLESGGRAQRSEAKLFVPAHRHYSWKKGVELFGIGSANLRTIELDAKGRAKPESFKREIERAAENGTPILGVVSVFGTTELGQLDPIDEIQNVIEDLRRQGLTLTHHVDAAYGGFLGCLRGLESLDSRTRDALEALGRVDSITLDPHKLGYVPYACGAFLARDPERYSTLQVDAPYLTLGNDVVSDWSSTIEGSRSAAGAAAVWLTHQSLEFSPKGFGRMLEKTIEARGRFERELLQTTNLKPVLPCDTNVLTFAVARQGQSLSRVNERTQQIFNAIESGPEFSVSRTTLSRNAYRELIEEQCRHWSVTDDGVSDLFVIRLVLMNPFIVSKEMAKDFAAAFRQHVQELDERLEFLDSGF